MRRSTFAWLALPLFAGCDWSSDIDAGLAGRAKTVIASKYAPLTPTFGSIWIARDGGDLGFVCGRIEAPAALEPYRDTLRFVYLDSDGHGQIEYHELWVGDAFGTSIVEANRTIFNKLWKSSCAPSEPIASRISDWF